MGLQGHEVMLEGTALVEQHGTPRVRGRNSRALDLQALPRGHLWSWRLSCTCEEGQHCWGVHTWTESWE